MLIILDPSLILRPLVLCPNKTGSIYLDKNNCTTIGFNIK